MNKKNRNWMIVGIGILAAVVAAGVWIVGESPDAGKEAVDKVPVRKKSAIPKVDSKSSRKPCSRGLRGALRTAGRRGCV